MSSSADFDSDALLCKIQSTYSNTSINISQDESPIVNLFTINVPKSAFVDHPKSWEDLKSYSPTCQILQTLCGALSVSALKADDDQQGAGNVFNSPFYNNSVQKVHVYIELLVSCAEFESDEDLYDSDNVVGYRLWFYFKEMIDINSSVENAYRAAKITQEKKEQRSTRKYIMNVFERCQDFKVFFIDLYRNITTRELSGAFDFFNVFNSERCIKNSPFEISDKQKSLSTYFDTDLGCSANSLHRNFVLPRLFISVNISCFSELLKVPLPRFEILRVLNLGRTLEQLKENIQIERNIIEILKDQLTDENKASFDDHCEKLELYTNEASNVKNEMDAFITMSFNNRNEIEILSVLDKIRQYDPMVELRYQSIVMLSDLNESAKDLTYTQWAKERKNIQEKLFKKWEIAILNEKNPAPLINAYKTIRSTRLKQRPTTYENMSVFGNYIINLASVATEYLTVQPNLRAFTLIHFVHLSCYEFTTGMRVNGILIGPPGGGKTEIVTRASCISPDGTFNVNSHQSDMSTFVPGPSPFNSSTIFRDELPNKYLGIDQHGKLDETEQYNRFKNLLTSGIQNSDVFQRAEVNGREMRTHGSYTAWNTANYLVSVNATPKLTKTSPIGSRFLTIPINSSVENPEYKVYDRIYKDKKNTPEALEQFKQHQIDEKLFNLVQSMITGNVIKKPNMLVAKWVLRIVFDHLGKSGIPHTTERLTNSYMKICETLTITGALNFLFRSEYSLKFSQGKNDKFDFRNLLRVEPYLFCSFEIATFVLSLLRDQLTDVTESRVIDAISKKLLDHFPPQGRNDKSTKWRVVDSEEEDYNQICISGSNFDVILKTIQSALGNSISSEEIHQAIINLEAKPVTKNVKMVYRFKDERIETPIPEKESDVCQNCGETDKLKIHPCNCGMSFCLPTIKFCSVKCIECSEPLHNGCKQNWKCDECNLVMHMKCRYRHGDLIKTDVIKRRIPIIEIVYDRLSNQTCLYLATSAIGNNPVKIFNEAIKNLSHRYMSENEMTFITANYVEKDIPSVLSNGPYTIYDLFDVVKITKDDKVHIIKNYDKTSSHIERVLFDRKKEIDEDDVEFSIEDDFDTIAAKQRLTEIGDLTRLDEEATLIIPNNQRKYINCLRKKYDNMFGNTGFVYPKDPVDEKVKEILLLKERPNRVRPPFDSIAINKKFKPDNDDSIVSKTNSVFSMNNNFTIPNNYKIPNSTKTKKQISSTDVFN